MIIYSVQQLHDNDDDDDYDSLYRSYSCALCTTVEVAEKWIANRLRLYGLLLEIKELYVQPERPRYHIAAPESFRGKRRWEEMGYKLEDRDPEIRKAENKRWDLLRQQYNRDYAIWAEGCQKFENEVLENEKRHKMDHIDRFISDDRDATFIFKHWSKTCLPNYKIEERVVLEDV